MPRILPPALILAGGLSRRMGEDKTQMRLGGSRMIDLIAGRLRPQVSALWLNAPTGYPAPDGLDVIPDGLGGHQGPLAGLLTGLQHAARATPGAGHLLTVPGDAPFLPPDLVDRLLSSAAPAQAIILAASKGRDHPVVALWPLSLAGDLALWLNEPGNRRVMSFIGRHPHVPVDFPAGRINGHEVDPFFNVNTPDDYARASRLLEASP